MSKSKEARLRHASRTTRVVWKDPHPPTLNTFILIAYLHHEKKFTAPEAEDNLVNRLDLSEMTGLPPSVVLSENPEEIHGPVYDFYKDSSAAGREQDDGPLDIEDESGFFHHTTRAITDSVPLRKMLGPHQLTRFSR